MRKLFAIFCFVLMTFTGWAKFVPQQDAAMVAVKFYQLNNTLGVTNPEVLTQTVRWWENVPSIYIFRFVSGGFVLVAADDASIPILGYSFENDMPAVIDHPSLDGWLNDYSREISFIINNNLDNTETLKQWNDIRNGEQQIHASDNTHDVPQLLTTTWDQGCFYNTLCPSASGGQCGHVWTGCVATAMAQIMKYHNFPPQGVGQHTYTDPTYGLQTADFGNTIYDWSSMPNSVTSSNVAVATLMYHDGVSVEMQYGTSGSGAFSENVPNALKNYFNYSPDIDIKYKDSYANVDDFKSLLRADLDASLPIYYSGSNTTEGHAWVCDGYRMSDGKFHFNWGWSGSSNGYYAIGNLNPGGSTFNLNNTVVLHIKPYNPNLIVRITHPVNKAIIGVGYSVDITAVVVRGSANTMKIFIDSVERFSTTGDSITYTWNTSAADLGSHTVMAYAYNSTDTVYNKELVNVAEWISQASGFTTPSRAITYLSAVDSNIVWGTAADGNNLSGACSDFTKTMDGGNNWTPGVITNTTGLSSAMIFAMNADTAYVAMYKVTGNKPMGIYMTSDGGTTWARQSTASFSNSSSFPDIVHFFNTTDGVAMGDPINGKFEIYTTTDGGSNWSLISASGNPAPLSGEFGVVGYYSAVHDTIWFGTNKGRIYKSENKGVAWTVASAPGMSAAYVKPVFKDGSHGLVIDESTGAGGLCESSDGGATWTPVIFTGPNYSGDLSFVPETPNTWVRSGSANTLGCAYSFDGGHTWADFVGTTGAPYYQMTWVNNHCGWSGGINATSTENGAYKFIGKLQQPLPPPQNVMAVAIAHDVTINWIAPNYTPGSITLQGYNITRNGTKINATLVTTLSYLDQNVTSGQYTYCVSAHYDIGESPDSCNTVDVAVGIAQANEPGLFIYPNPAHSMVFVKTSDISPEITICSQTGNTMPAKIKNLSADRLAIDISNLPAGIYILSVRNTQGIKRTKLVVY
ncbi:MAG: C10 family peptidase [Bacteroidales bacterium]|nr:C10 family peptidase [Bacteroidales bacterium]